MIQRGVRVRTRERGCAPGARLCVELQQELQQEQQRERGGGERGESTVTSHQRKETSCGTHHALGPCLNGHGVRHLGPALTIHNSTRRLR